MGRARRTSRSLAKVDTDDLPEVVNEPTLEDWLESVRAELLWEHYGKNGRGGVPSYRVAAYRVGERTVMVVIQSHQAGWDLFTSSGSDDADEVIQDAEVRLSR